MVTKNPQNVHLKVLLVSLNQLTRTSFPPTILFEVLPSTPHLQLSVKDMGCTTGANANKPV